VHSNEPSGRSCVTPFSTNCHDAVMTANCPLPNDLNALKEIIGGRPADRPTMKRLVRCNLVEEFDGTALLTARGIEAAALLMPNKHKKKN
jgi:hypothetical protein